MLQNNNCNLGSLYHQIIIHSNTCLFQSMCAALARDFVRGESTAYAPMPGTPLSGLVSRLTPI